MPTQLLKCGMFEKHKNADGTYNGVTFLAELSKIPVAEVAWTAGRIKHLMTVEGHSKAVAIAIIKEERKSKPWVVP
jgi:hypothetical protein